MPCLPLYGEDGVRNGVVCITPVVTLNVNGIEHRFENHSYFGPTRLTKTDEPYKRFWSERSPFWNVYSLWCDQGKRVDENGYGIVDKGN